DGTVDASVSLTGADMPSCGCEDPGMVLNYNGATVAVNPTIQTTYGTDPNSALPASVKTQLTWNGGASQATVTYGTTGDTAGDVLAMDQQVSTAVTATGAYPSTVVVTVGTTNTTLSGTAYL